MQVNRRQFFKICSAGLGGSSIAVMGFSPTAALAVVRTYKLARATETRSTCPYCSVACGLLVYSSLDVIGVQVCAAAKNVVAVAFGMLDAIAEDSDAFGDNTESLLLAAGLNEIQLIGRAMGATHPETFTSISGVGDLDVTCRSKYGRNRRFGQDIIKKKMLKEFSGLDDLLSRITEIGYLPEGAVACKYVHELSLAQNLKLPICNGLFAILNKEKEPQQFIEQLLNGEQI